MSKRRTVVGGQAEQVEMKTRKTAVRLSSTINEFEPVRAAIIGSLL
jgi:hypothetical protein